jgi:hypothetical protein
MRIPKAFKLEQDDLQHWACEYTYREERINVSSLVNDLEIPTMLLPPPPT